MGYLARVLVANNEKEENQMWRTMLSRSGYELLPDCYDLSTMVHLLARNEVDIAICSMRMVGDSAAQILKTCSHFFPRIRIVVIGPMVNRGMMLQMEDIIFRNQFGTDLVKYLRPQVDVKIDIQKTVEQLLLLLLEENYLSHEEAFEFLNRVMPHWNPEFVVISIRSNDYGNEIYKIVNEISGELRPAYVMQMGLEEVCCILERSPSVEYCLAVAENIRYNLMQRTGATFSIGVSRSRTFADEMYACRKEALRAADATHHYGKNSVIHISYLDANDYMYSYPEHKERRMIEAVLDGDEAVAVQMLDDIFRILRRGTIEQSIINKISLKVLVGIHMGVITKSTMFNKIQMDSLALSKLLAASTMDASYQFLRNVIHDLSKEMQDITELHMDALFMKLCKIKEDNKDPNAEAHVGLEDLTSVLQTTVGFLNTAVKKNTDSSLLEFFEES